MYNAMTIRNQMKGDMKQKIITSASTHEFKTDLEIAINLGWIVKSVIANNGMWLAVLTRDVM